MEKRVSLHQVVLGQMDPPHKRMTLEHSNIIHKNKLKMDERPTFKIRHYKTTRGKHRQKTL